MADEQDAPGIWARSTAPQSTYGTSDLLTGVVVLIVGLALTFGLALALA